MSWMVGAGLGFFLGGPLGAVVGGATQHLLTKSGQKSFEQTGPASEEARFVTYLVAIMTKIAMADGRILKSEVQVIHSFFASELGYSGLELHYIDGLILHTQQVNPDLGVIARNFKDSSNREGCLLLLDLCYKVAAASGTISLQEQHELGFLAESIRINREEHERIRYKYSGFEGSSHHATGERVFLPVEDHYAVLGVSPTATNEKIKKAYRQMAAQYHPDKVSHLGKELIEFANRKFKEINDAYSSLRKARRF